MRGCFFFSRSAHDYLGLLSERIPEVGENSLADGFQILFGSPSGESQHHVRGADPQSLFDEPYHVIWAADGASFPHQRFGHVLAGSDYLVNDRLGDRELLEVDLRLWLRYLNPFSLDEIPAGRDYAHLESGDALADLFRIRTYNDGDHIGVIDLMGVPLCRSCLGSDDLGFFLVEI